MPFAENVVIRQKLACNTSCDDIVYHRIRIVHDEHAEEPEPGSENLYLKLN